MANGSRLAANTAAFDIDINVIFLNVVCNIKRFCDDESVGELGKVFLERRLIDDDGSLPRAEVDPCYGSLSSPGSI
jgi:hypothetical protein